MLDDILQFAAETLVDDGRLSFWMPTSNDEDQDIPIPAHLYLERLSVCTQVFNKCTSSTGAGRSITLLDINESPSQGLDDLSHIDEFLTRMLTTLPSRREQR